MAPRPHTNGTCINSRERYCTECGRRIPIERLRTLPDTWTCVVCSEEPKVMDAESLVEEDQS